MMLTTKRVSELHEVNKEVNKYPYKTDYENYEKQEYWDDIDQKGAGDCEDYAITKLHRLLALGWDISDLKLATCWTETMEYHAVLTVDTDMGTYVLDNRYENPMPWASLPYTWDKRQIKGAEWEKIPT